MIEIIDMPGADLCNPLDNIEVRLWAGPQYCAGLGGQEPTRDHEQTESQETHNFTREPCRFINTQSRIWQNYEFLFARARIIKLIKLLSI